MLYLLFRINIITIKKLIFQQFAIQGVIMPLNDKLFMLPAGNIHLQGRLGKALELTRDNRLKKVDYAKLVRSFRDYEDHDGRWRGEFWGKIVRSAIRVWQLCPDEELAAMIRAAVKGLCDCADTQGALTTYPPDIRCTDWDIWCRKYALLGLARYYRVMDQDPAVLETIRRHTDALLKDQPFDNPPPCPWHDGMAAFSVLGGIQIAARLTGEKRFADAAEDLVKRGCTFSGTLFEDFLAGKRPKDLANGKAYEMTSCFEGLLELYRDSGNRQYLDWAEAYFQDIINCEMIITGTAGGGDIHGEYWYDGAVHQMTRNPEYSMGETCVTATLLRFTFQLLRLTGNSRYADVIEYTVYNAAMGSMKYDGSWYIHRNPTPLAGVASKLPAGDQLPGYGEDCCLAQGPEALGVGGVSAVMRTPDGLAVNLYENMLVKTEINSIPLKLQISGDYPVGNVVTIKVTPAEKCEFPLLLRIPQWCSEAQLEVDGQIWRPAPGRYARIVKSWSAGSVISLTFNMPITTVSAPDKSGRFAVRRGPVLLVQDSRIGSVNTPVELDESMPEHLSTPEITDIYCWQNGTKLCDFASAGNLFESENTLCVWLKGSEE